MTPSVSKGRIEESGVRIIINSRRHEKGYLIFGASLPPAEAGCFVRSVLEQRK
jgi:hypothetical protein